MKPPHVPTSRRPLQEAYTLPRDGSTFPDIQHDVPIGTLCYFDTPPSSNRSSFDSVQFHSTKDSSSYSSCNPSDLSFSDDKGMCKTPSKTVSNPFESSDLITTNPPVISNHFQTSSYSTSSSQFSSSTPKMNMFSNFTKCIENIPPPPILPPRPSAMFGKGRQDILENVQRPRISRHMKVG